MTKPAFRERRTWERARRLALGDTVARVGGDPVRKLGPEDRLVGGGKLAQEYGVFPTSVCKAIAAALHFNPPGDRTAPQIQNSIREKDICETLREASGLDEDSKITEEVVRQYDRVVREFEKQAT